MKRVFHACPMFQVEGEEVEEEEEEEEEEE
jgi:hypothetical protein